MISMSTTLLLPWIDDDDADVERASIRLPPEPHTLAGFRSWVLSDDVPEKLRVSYLRGRITVDMSKEEILTHSAVKTEIAITMGSAPENDGWLLSRVFPFFFQLTRKRDRRGGWQYCLAYKGV